MIRAAAIALALLCSGCFLLSKGPRTTPDVTRGADEARARELVWSGFGGKGVPPRVEWVTDLEACSAKRPGELVGFTARGQCVAGITTYDGTFSRIAWLGSYHRSAYAHELYHSWRVQNGLDGDSQHLAPEWKGLVRDLQHKLEAEGL